MIIKADVPPVTSSLDAAAIAVMLLLFLSWGFSQVAVKLALPDIAPVTQAAIRSIGGLIVVMIGVRIRGIDIFKRDHTLWAGLWLGVIFGIEFIMINIGLTLTSATRASVFLYTSPFFVALGAVTFLGERLDAAQWAGLALSFLGIVIAIGVPQAGVDAKVLAGDALMIGGAMLWAATTLLFKATGLLRAPPEKAMAYQLAVSAPVLVLGAWVAGEPVPYMPGAVALGSMIYQTVWVVGCTFLIWYMLMARYPVSKLSAFTFITPLFGVAAGRFVLGEPLSIGFALAVILVVAGLILVNRVRSPR